VEAEEEERVQMNLLRYCARVMLPLVVLLHDYVMLLGCSLKVEVVLEELVLIDLFELPGSTCLPRYV